MASYGDKVNFGHSLAAAVRRASVSSLTSSGTALILVRDSQLALMRTAGVQAAHTD